MPEGPSPVILKEQTARFEGQEIVRADGDTWAIDGGHKANLGRTNRRSFWCERCQKRYG